jgi:hypothetical protein
MTAATEAQLRAKEMISRQRITILLAELQQEYTALTPRYSGNEWSVVRDLAKVQQENEANLDDLRTESAKAAHPAGKSVAA